MSRDTTEPSKASPRVIIVDDSPADTRLTIEALKDSVPDAVVETYESGEALLEGIRTWSDSRLPDLLLLDLNLPGIQGLEVLSALKEDRKSRVIPIAILSGSMAQEDVHSAYFRQANCFIHKTDSLDGYLTNVAVCARFWLHTAARVSTVPRAKRVIGHGPA